MSKHFVASELQSVTPTDAFNEDGDRTPEGRCKKCGQELYEGFCVNRHCGFHTHRQYCPVGLTEDKRTCTCRR